MASLCLFIIAQWQQTTVGQRDHSKQELNLPYAPQYVEAL